MQLINKDLIQKVGNDAVRLAQRKSLKLKKLKLMLVLHVMGNKNEYKTNTA